MKCEVYDSSGTTLLYVEERTPRCGFDGYDDNDYCAECGDCLACYAEDGCKGVPGAEHRWVVYSEVKRHTHGGGQ